MVNEITDEELLARTARGDVTAFEVFYRRWMPAVISYHRQATGSAELALDLTAETFASVIASIDRFDAQRGSASNWLFGIARHKLHDSFRRAKVEASAREALGWERVAVADDDLERVDQIASEGRDALARLIGELPADQRAALMQRVVDEREYAAIAADMECSEMLVRQRVHRALRRLRRRLEEAA